MTKYRVKAFFMHEHEQAAASDAVTNSVISDAEITDGYVMGVVDEADIKQLSDKGLVVAVVEQVAGPGDAAPTGGAPTAGAPGVMAMAAPSIGPPTRMAARHLPVAEESAATKNKVISRDSKRKQIYVVRFHGPITRERRKELKDLGIKLIQRLTRNKYSVELLPSEIDKFAALPSVDYVRLYTAEDTLRLPPTGDISYEKLDAPATPASLTATPRAAERTLLYNVELHKKTDMRAVVKWLAEKKRKPIWKSGARLQVALLEDGKLLKDLAARPEVAVIEPVEAPRVCDSFAREILGLKRKTVSIGLEGDGELIGIADTGIDVSHPDFAGRIAGTSAWGRKNDVSDPEGHGTHVAGCALGDGTASGGEVVGAAPKARLFFQSILDKNGNLGGLPKDIGELLKEAYDKGVRIHNNSWGAFTFARYAPTALDVDKFVAAHPDMLVVIAAGNDGIAVPRAAGSLMSSAKGFVDWPCVASPATSKNGLTVGASRSSRKAGGYSQLTWNDCWPDRYPDAPISSERISSNDQSLAAFSSRGPGDGNLFKPDVVAPGTDIAAARSKDAPLHKFWGPYPKNQHYGFMGGTSMAAPYVTGCAALVREWYRKNGNCPTPSAALLKATLINGTKRITGNDAVAILAGDPNYHQGFGRIDMPNTIPNPIEPKLRLAFVDEWKDKKGMFTETGQRFRFSITSGTGLPLKLCLAWTDPPARSLQNSLLLLVDDQAQTKWAGNSQAASTLNVAGAPRDTNNNVQVVRIDAPIGGSYTIVVVASMILSPPQSFALVVTGDLQSPLNQLP